MDAAFVLFLCLTPAYQYPRKELILLSGTLILLPENTSCHLALKESRPYICASHKIITNQVRVCKELLPSGHSKKQ